MKSSPFFVKNSALIGGVVVVGLLMVTACRPVSPVNEETSTTTHTVQPKDPPSSVTYPQIYATPDGETHFREVTLPLTQISLAPPASPIYYGPVQSATTLRWAVFPKHYGIEELQQNIRHNPSALRFFSIREGKIGVKTSDGEVRYFQKGDIVEAIDGAPSKGHITWSEQGAVALFSNYP
jgi:hypothetical protein